MKFTESGPYAWKSAEGYSISRAVVGDSTVYTAWYAKQPIGECHRAPNNDPTQRKSAWLNCRDACIEHHKQRQFQRKHKGG